jgi:hypothetical protein
MRGEETQIAGFLAQNPGFDGVLCLPGTHTKWVHISAGEVVSFRSFMTGELFATVGPHSVLRHSVGEGWDDAAFGRGRLRCPLAARDRWPPGSSRSAPRASCAPSTRTPPMRACRGR